MRSPAAESDFAGPRLLPPHPHPRRSRLAIVHTDEALCASASFEPRRRFAPIEAGPVPTSQLVVTALAVTGQEGSRS